jgi:hypothetical protein
VGKDNTVIHFCCFIALNSMIFMLFSDGTEKALALDFVLGMFAALPASLLISNLIRQ